MNEWTIMAYAFAAGLFLGGGLGLWVGLAVRPIHRGEHIVKELSEKPRRREPVQPFV